MEKISSREAVASRLKQKEEQINRRIEALQGEMTSTRVDVKNYLKDNPWIGVAGSVCAGIVVGLIAGKKSKKTRQKELLDTYISRLTEAAQETGVSEREVGALLREALHETVSPAAYSEPKSKSSGLSGKLMSMALEMAMGFAKKSFLNFLEDKASTAGSSEIEKEDDSEN